MVNDSQVSTLILPIYSSIPQTSVEPLLGPSHCSEHWRYSGERDRQKPPVLKEIATFPASRSSLNRKSGLLSTDVVEDAHLQHDWIPRWFESTTEHVSFWGAGTCINA